MPPKQQPTQGFVSVDRVRCPDCEDRDALRNDGGAKVIGGGQLKGSTVDVGITTASAGCESCRSKGWIPTNDPEALLRAGITDVRKIERDPYSMPLSPEHAARVANARQDVH